MQQIFSELWRNLSPEAQKVLKENGLDSYEKLTPWIVGESKDFPNANRKTQFDLDSFIIEIRKKMVERLTTNIIEPEKKEEKLEETAAVETPEQPVVASKEDAKEDIPAQTGEDDGNDKETELPVSQEGLDYDKLQRKYDELLNNTPDKVRNFAMDNNLLKVDKVIELYNKNCFKKDSFCGDKIDNAYYKYYKKVITRFIPLLSKVDYSDPFVERFKERYNHAPMFYLLKKHLMSTEDENDLIFAYRYGVLDNLPRKYKEVAKEVGKSPETARKGKYSNELNLIGFAEDWSKYEIMKDQCVFDVDNKTNDIQMQEWEDGALSDTDIYAGFALKGYCIKYLWKENKDYKPFKLDSNYPVDVAEGVVIHAIAIKSNLSGFEFHEVLNDIDSYFNMTKHDDLDKSLNDYMNDKKFWHSKRKPKPEKEDISVLIEPLKEMIGEYFDKEDVKINGDRVFKKNDYSKDIEEILTAGGNTISMDRDDVREKLKKMNPREKHWFEDDSRFKSLLSNYKQKFQTDGRGRSGSKIGMKNWGTLTDGKGKAGLVDAIIDEATEPLTFKQIENLIKERIQDNYDTENDKDYILQVLRQHNHLCLVRIEDINIKYWFSRNKRYDINVFRIYDNSLPRLKVTFPNGFVIAEKEGAVETFKNALLQIGLGRIAERCDIIHYSSPLVSTKEHDDPKKARYQRPIGEYYFCPPTPRYLIINDLLELDKLFDLKLKIEKLEDNGEYTHVTEKMTNSD